MLRKVEKRFGVDAADTSAFMKEADESLRVNEETMTLIEALRKSRRGLKIYGMTNTPKPEQGHIHSTLELWPTFDHIFISSDVGMRKPDLCFYNHVLEQVGIPADSVIFEDDCQENILSALSLGMCGIQFTSHENFGSQLLNILDDPMMRGYSFLDNNAKQPKSITNQGHVIKDNFAQLLILEMTKRRYDAAVIYPALNGPEPEISDLVELDPVVCVNVLTLFLKHGRQDELKPTWDWILRVMENRSYLNGTRYYSSPESFLFFLARLTKSLRVPSLRSQLLPILKARITERIGEAGDPSALAMRVLACKILSIPSPRDMDRLRFLQCGDGGWPAGAIYIYGRSGLELGNRGLVTSIALKAIDMPDLVQDVSIHVRTFSLGNPFFMVKHVLESLVRKKSSSLGLLSVIGLVAKKYEAGGA